MASSFNGVDLFGPGPHRFAQGRQGNLVVSVAAYLQTFLPGSISYGLHDLDVIVTGRLVADTEAALWARRDAIVAVLQHPPAPATLVDHHGREWTGMSFWRFDEGSRTDRGRRTSLAFRAVFRASLLAAGEGPGDPPTDPDA